LTAVSDEFGREIPDNLVGDLETPRDLIKFLSTPVPMAVPKGLPKWEIFGGRTDLPPNITLVDYRKKKWTPKIARTFVEKRRPKIQRALKGDQ